MFSNQVEAKEAQPGSCVRSRALQPLTKRSTAVLRHMFIGDRSGGSEKQDRKLQLFLPVPLTGKRSQCSGVPHTTG